MTQLTVFARAGVHHPLHQSGGAAYAERRVEIAEARSCRLRRAVDAVDAVVERIARPCQWRDVVDLRRHRRLCLVFCDALAISAQEPLAAPRRFCELDETADRRLTGEV